MNMRIINDSDRDVFNKRISFFVEEILKTGQYNEWKSCFYEKECRKNERKTNQLDCLYMLLLFLLFLKNATSNKLIKITNDKH